MSDAFYISLLVLVAVIGWAIFCVATAQRNRIIELLRERQNLIHERDTFRDELKRMTERVESERKAAKAEREWPEFIG